MSRLFPENRNSVTILVSSIGEAEHDGGVTQVSEEERCGGDRAQRNARRWPAKSQNGNGESVVVPPYRSGKAVARARVGRRGGQGKLKAQRGSLAVHEGKFKRCIKVPVGLRQGIALTRGDPE